MSKPKEKSTRRQFISKTSIAIGISVVGASALVAKKVSAPTKPVKFVRSSCGTMAGDSGKILVTYASQFGSTGEVGQAIGRQICNNSIQVDILPIQDVADIEVYDAVIIGSAIQYDKWMPQAVEFTHKHQGHLKTIPVGLFFTCLTLSRKNNKSRQQAQTYADNLARDFEAIKPISIGQFAGVLDYQKISPFSRIFARGLFAILGVKQGDHRDWRKIATWTNQVSLQFIKQIT